MPTTVTDTRVVGHPDKVEIFVKNSAQNCLMLPDVYPQLIQEWSKRFNFHWRHELKGSNWEVNGWNDQFRVTFLGWAKDVADNASWKANPFSGSRFKQLYGGSRRGTVGQVRFTTKLKDDPVPYLQYLSQVFKDIEVFGLDEKPRLIEIALDVYGNAAHTRNSVRLAKDKPHDLQHWHRDKQGYIAGGCRDGRFTEYSMRTSFLSRNRETRELCVYPRPEGFFRVELRLGSDPLRNFLGSSYYERAVESSQTPLLLRDYSPKVTSPTLDLMGLLPQLALQHLVYETIDLDQLKRDHPASRYWRLKGQTTRHVRYVLDRRGFKPRDIARYSVSGILPRLEWLFPMQFQV